MIDTGQIETMYFGPHLPFQRALAFVAFLVALYTSHLFSQQSNVLSVSDWPTIRGSAWNGISDEEGIAETWPQEGLPVLWTRELGQGYSAFIAWDNSVATQYQTLAGQYIVCLSAENGQTKWEYRYGWPYDPAGVYPGPRSTPTYKDGFVYFTSPSGLVGCLNADTGRLIWSVDLEQQFRVKVPGFGYACSPIVQNDSILLPVGASDASIVALDRHTGRVRWQSSDLKSMETPKGTNAATSKASYCSAYPISFRGRSMVVCFLQNALVCHDVETGKQVWRYEISSGYDEHSAWPIYEEPYLWITGPFQRGSELLELTDDPKHRIRTVRKTNLMSNDIFSSVQHKGTLFGFDLHEAQAKTHRTSRGIFRCLDFQSGAELWSIGNGRINRSPSNTQRESNVVSKSATGEAFIGHSTVLVVDGKLILFNDLGELILARASREKYEELCRTTLLSGEICWTQPAISRRRLFVRNQSRAVCVYLGTPETLAPQAKANSITVSQIPQSKFRDVAGIVLGIEPEYLFDVPSMRWLWQWYLISLFGVLAGCYVFVVVCYGLVHLTNRKPSVRESKTHDVVSVSTAWAFWILAFIAGALGTTLLSRWTQEFIFTWPVCLFVAWHAAISNLSTRSANRTRQSRLKSASAAIFLLIVCLVYFLLCRRLSLVFEWVFLCGFPAAVPFGLAGKYLIATGRWAHAWRLLMTALAFSAFYWSSVAFLHLRSG